MSLYLVLLFKAPLARGCSVQLPFRELNYRPAPENLTVAGAVWYSYENK